MSFQITGTGWEKATQQALDRAIENRGNLEAVKVLIYQNQLNELADLLDENRFNSTEFVTDALVVVEEGIPQLWFKTSVVQ